MSATGRRHRRAAGRHRVAEAMRDAAGQPVVTVATAGAFEMVKKGDVVFMLPRLQPGMAPALLEALRLRREATLTGRCACGGRRHDGRPRPGHVGHAAVVHEHDCPASDTAILELARRTGWSGGAA